ncbi:acyltransferase [Cupriavidus sp. UGS-1]|uniref:acyltransferase family protein n=1 Tax=Cupriavidus sp. UGS-1 TaxID=2899826 RepID=UPI001E6171AC|nr:acyltransferase [Cupriavidus sp. UGS-1]MCD9124002.1 acyltransferase [Cupriavidus sp. UGS-1]
MTNNNNQRIGFIQSFRGIAALLVVLYHGSSAISPYGTGTGDLLFGPAGSFGVTLFFIISGFIMAHTTVGARVSPQYALEFCVRRMARIWPVLAIASVAFVLLARVPFGQFTRETVHTLLHTLAFVPAGDSASPQFGETLPSVSWTLNYEVYFYLFFAASMLFGWYRWLALAAWAMATLIALPLLTVGTWTTHSLPAYGFGPAYVRMATHPLIWEFLAGVAIGLLYNSRFRLPDRFPVGLLMTLSAAMVAWQYSARFNIGYGVTEWGLTLIPLVAVFALANKRAELAQPAGLVYLGNISFSLYLWHPLAQTITGYPLTWLGYGDRCTGFSFLLLTTIVSVALAALSYHLLELGLSEAVKRWGLARVRRRGQQLAAEPRGASPA